MYSLWPAELTLRLHLLCTTPTPAWVLSGTSEQVDRAVGAFVQRDWQSQLSPVAVRILLEAVRSQVAQYASLPPLQSNADSARAFRRQRAETLVQDELALWARVKGALEKLPGGCTGASKGSNAKRKR